MEYDIEEILYNFEDDYNPGPRPMNQGPRNMYAGGQLVQPNADGSRPGYNGKKKINRDESYRTIVKDFTATSGPGTGKIFDDPAAIEIVKANLNKIKKQKNNKALFEWSENSDWYKTLQQALNPNTKNGTNREYTNKLINKVVDEFFPGAYHGKNAITNFRNDMVVKSFIQHLKSVGEFDGQEKFDKVLDQFTYKKDGKRKNADHLYEDINRSWKSWLKGEFEVEGVDRADLKKELKARGIDYNQITNWSASQAQGRGTAKIKEIKWLDNQNSKFANRSPEKIKALFKKKFPNGNFELRINELTQLKRNGVYISGANTEKGITGISKGDRASWLKQAYGKQFAGNYSKIINAADQLAAAGEIAKAERLYKAADQFFGPNGIVRKSAVGEAEHALARSFDFLNPDRQLAINSIVSGDLNQFKKNLFDVPVKNYFNEYNNPNTTKARRVELKNLIEERKKIMNAITGGQKSGIVAGDIVNFRYGANEITPTSSVKPIDILFKEGKFNIDEYIERGNKYTEAFQTATKDIDIKKDFSTPIYSEKELKKLVNQIGPCGAGKKKAMGGRIGLKTAGDVCMTGGRQTIAEFLKNGFKNANGEQKEIFKKILSLGSGAIKGVGSMLDPRELFKIKNLVGPAAWAAMGAFETGAITYDVVNNNIPLNEALGSNWITKFAMPYTLKEAQIKNLEDSKGFSVSPAAKEYMAQTKLMANFEREFKALEGMKMGVFGTETPKELIQDQEKKLENIVRDVVKLQASPVAGGAGQLDFDKAFGEMAEKRGAGYYDPENEDANEYGYVDVGDSIFGFKQGTPLTYKYKKDRGKDQGRNLSETEREAEKLFPFETGTLRADYTPFNYKSFNYTPQELPADMVKQYEKDYNLPPRTSLNQFNFKGSDNNVLQDLTNEYNMTQRAKQASKYPGYYGTQSPYSKGGIASLNVKK